MNKNYKVTVSLNEPISFNLTEEGLKYINKYLKENNFNTISVNDIFSFSKKVDYKYSSSLKLLFKIFGYKMYVGSLPVFKNNTLFIDSGDQAVNLNDKVCFKNNDYGTTYFEKFVKEEQIIYKLDFQRNVKKNTDNEIVMTFHNFWHVFYLSLGSINDKDVNITENNIIRIEYQY